MKTDRNTTVGHKGLKQLAKYSEDSYANLLAVKDSRLQMTVILRPRVPALTGSFSKRLIACSFVIVSVTRCGLVANVTNLYMWKQT